MTDTLKPPPTTSDATPATAAATTADSAWPEGIPKRMTLEEYLAWDFEEVRAEWVDGKVVLMSPASAAHQRIMFFLARLLAEWCEEYQLGEVFTSGMRVVLTSTSSWRDPDVIFVAAEHCDRIHESSIEGGVDLAVEIMSPESEARDRAIKLAEYEAAGIPEYWLIDPLRHEATFNVLGDDGRYHPAPVSPDGIYHSKVVTGFRLRVDWLWREPLPTPSAARAELSA